MSSLLKTLGTLTISLCATLGSYGSASAEEMPKDKILYQFDRFGEVGYTLSTKRIDGSFLGKKNDSTFKQILTDDVNNDGYPEIIGLTNNGRIIIFENTFKNKTPPKDK
ncbi:MAG: hypothetical protein ABIA78_03730 [archaeon]